MASVPSTTQSIHPASSFLAQLTTFYKHYHLADSLYSILSFKFPKTLEAQHTKQKPMNMGDQSNMNIYVQKHLIQAILITAWYVLFVFVSVNMYVYVRPNIHRNNCHRKLGRIFARLHLGVCGQTTFRFVFLDWYFCF